jgi:ATP-binding cassette subfamily B protein
MLRGPLEQITRQLQDLQNATAGIARIDELLGVEQDTRDGPGVDLAPAPLSVAFDHVTFAYRENEPVLEDLSFEVEAGRSLGLIGRTGSGKTTIARLLFRLYDPQQGRIRVGGANAESFVLADLRRRVAMVTQDVQIFEASVRDNLTLFQDDIPDTRIVEVVETLGLRSWYDRMPGGLDTPLESGGTNLSAGEAQLLAFTRVFLRDPGLVILDEPSSRMDPVTEQLVKQSIRRLLADRTAIIIAHRLSTLEMVDDVLLLDEGRVLEYGSREALAADPASKFHALLNLGLGSDMV